MKKTRAELEQNLADAHSEIRMLRRQCDDYLNVGAIFMLLFVIVSCVFIYNNHKMSQALREKNYVISMLKSEKEEQEATARFYHKCMELSKYVNVSYIKYTDVCFAGNVQLSTLEELDKALLHFRLGEAKK